MVEERLQERPNRFDYVFTWEQEDFRAKDATCRRTLVVQGGEIGSYREYLHVPEEWQRSFQALRSKNALYATIAESLYLPLGLAALAAVFLALRRGNLAWKPLVLIAGTVGAFMIVNEINALPFFVDRMPTSSPLPQSVLIGILQALGCRCGRLLLCDPGGRRRRATLSRRFSAPLGAARGLHVAGHSDTRVFPRDDLRLCLCRFSYRPSCAPSMCTASASACGVRRMWPTRICSRRRCRGFTR